MADLSMRLSNNYTLGEFLRSDTAERDPNLKQEQMNPSTQVVESLKYLVQTTLQPIREKFGYPIKISSGYRCPTINQRVGGSATSQHVLGEAADCSLAPEFLTDPKTEAIRKEISDKVKELTGKSLRANINANFYLFAYVCLNIKNLDIDQLIHEYGEHFGSPAWVHIASSKSKDKRQLLAVGSYTGKKYLSPSVNEALSYGTKDDTVSFGIEEEAPAENPVEEFLRSETAERDEKLKQQQMNPPAQVIESLKYLLEKTINPIREKFGFPIRITSGYRCLEINKMVGGSATSQHVLGEAADCSLSPEFLTDPKTAALRKEISDKVKQLTGKPVKSNASANYYLFAFVCLNMDKLDIDQVIHEYGEGFGDPAWVHIASSKSKDKRQILAVGNYTNKQYLKPSVKDAVTYGT